MAHTRIAAVYMLGNAGGLGPGHSLVVVGNDVYSYEGHGFGSGGGWQFFNTRQYLMQMNPGRPALVQELNDGVKFGPMAAYLVESLQRGDLYLIDGVCSSQAAVAIGKGSGSRYNPVGTVLPKNLFDQLARANLVSRTYYYWPSEPAGLLAAGRGLSPAQAVLIGRLQREHPGIAKAPADGILTWPKTELPKPPPSPPPVAAVRPPPEAAQAPRSDWLTGVQYRLKFLKHYQGPVNGANDPPTRTAVIAFQRAHKLAADGIPGPITQRQLVTVCGF
ncbi:MAG: peptidoglycan-binding protein [Comamonadaceae bacterium]|nr:MAG: peptidoglycan-binding protein [Comamonadaceae bacterium]